MDIGEGKGVSPPPEQNLISAPDQRINRQTPTGLQLGRGRGVGRRINLMRGGVKSVFGTFSGFGGGGKCVKTSFYRGYGSGGGHRGPYPPYFAHVQDIKSQLCSLVQCLSCSVIGWLEYLW